MSNLGRKILCTVFFVHLCICMYVYSLFFCICLFDWVSYLSLHQELRSSRLKGGMIFQMFVLDDRVARFRYAIFYGTVYVPLVRNIGPTCQENAKKKKRNGCIGQGLVIPAHSSHQMKLGCIGMLTVPLVWLAQTSSGVLPSHILARGSQVAKCYGRVQFSLIFLYDYSKLSLVTGNTRSFGFLIYSEYANIGAFMARGALHATVLGPYSST